MDAIKTIYNLLLKDRSEVTSWSRKGNEVWITVVWFRDPKKRNMNDHDYHTYMFKLWPEGNALICHFETENEMWSHY